ncbi:MAG: glycosyltransferase family 39 protein [bacterium]|nr:glycosyltransferase family 39 protein [candidate division KSB1 bacterium]MDH7559911.1 glycosyltransferase family 39 protein [bacterium]
MRGLGLAMLMLGLACRGLIARGLYALWRDSRTLLSAVGTALHSACRERLFIWTLVAFLLIGAAIRISFLFEPMSYDESATFVLHIDKPLRFALANYRHPGNHLLNTILAHVSVGIFGKGPWAIRLPALLAGICLIGLLYFVARRVRGPGAALIGAAVAAGSGCLVYYSTRGRGYILGALLFLGQLWLAEYARRHDNRAAWLLFAVAGALSMFTVPTMLYGVGIIYTYLVLCVIAGCGSGARGLMAVRMGWSAMVMAALTLLLYAPPLLVNGLREMTSNPVYQRLPLARFAKELWATLPGVWQLWHRDVPLVVQGVLLVGFLVSMFEPGESARARRLLVGGVPMFLVPVLLLHRVVPFPRVWLFLWPLYSACGAAGLSWGLEAVARRHAPTAVAAVASLLLVANSLTVLGARTRHANDYAHFHDGKEMAAFLAEQLAPGDKLLSPAPASMPLRYHFSRLGVDEGPMFRPMHQTERLWVVLNHPTSGPVESLADVLRNGRVPNEEFGEPVLIHRFPYASLYQMRRLPAERGHHRQ